MPHAPKFGAREWRLAYRVALRVLKTPDQAEDAAQDAMMRAYRARASYSGAARFESWLYRIALTTALSHLRKPHVRRAANDGEETVSRLTDEDGGPDELAEASELASCMRGCLDEMRELDRVAFEERFLLGTTERELGELLGVSTNAAKQRAFRARRTLRACVEAAGMEPTTTAEPLRRKG